MKHLISFLITIIMLASCAKKQEAMLSVTGTEKTDSLTLRVALMPTLGCIPVYYACQTGITDSLHLNIRLIPYSAQMDIDTAIIQGHADIAYTDIIRAIRLTDSVPITTFLANDEPITLVAEKGKKVKKVKQMNEKMIAICRLCATDYWCDKMLDSANISHDSIYRPQINDVKLRGKMMRTGLLEGAMLEEPYASWAVREGSKKLMQTWDASFRFAVWVTTDSLKEGSRKTDQTRKFIAAYKIAADNISKGLHADTLRSILIREYEIPETMVDSLQLPLVRQPYIPQKEDAEEALNWLTGRGITPKKFNSQTFINHTIANKP